jgi:hypothetical protein
LVKSKLNAAATTSTTIRSSQLIESGNPGAG